MNNIETISKKVLLKKVEDGVSKNKIWQKPLLLLTKDGSDYNYMSDSIDELYQTRAIVMEPRYSLIPQHYNLTLFISSRATKSCPGFCHVRIFTYLSVAKRKQAKL